VITGIQVSANLLACTHLNAPLIPRFVDRGTQRQDMHACPPGLPLSGIQVAKNLNLCGDEYVVRVNSLTGKVTQDLPHPSYSFLVSWDVTCTDPACTVTLTTSVSSIVLKQNQYKSSLNFNFGANSPPNLTYSISATAGGGTDTRILTTLSSSKP
jgi:hypothetical protein